MKQKFNLLMAVLCLSLIGVNKLEEKNFESKILFETSYDPIRMTKQKNYRQILNDMEEIGNVTVELSYDPFTLGDFVSKYGFYDKDMFRAELREYYTQKNNEIIERLNIQDCVLDMSNYSPYLCLDSELFTKDELYLECYELASNVNVEEIFITEQRVIKTTEISMEESELQPMTLASSTARVQYDNYPENCNLTGEGIKIGILENTGLNVNDPRLSEVDAEVVIDTVPENDVAHGICVALVMCSPIDGIAPGASIYYADVDSRANLLCLENLIDVGCDVVNMSFGILTLTDSVAYDASIEGYLDYLYNTTRIMMVASSGNGLHYVSQEGKVSLPASAANVIAVGSVSQDNYVSSFSSCNVLKKYIPNLKFLL